jgi:hypothetical protein
MDAEAFYQEAQKPEFGDTMVFELENVNPNNEYSFSLDGVEGVTDQMRAFFLARTLSRWHVNDKPPKKARIVMRVVWDDMPDVTNQPFPFFKAEFDSAIGLTLIDGEHRIPRKPLDSKEDRR